MVEGLAVKTPFKGPLFGDRDVSFSQTLLSIGALVEKYCSEADFLAFKLALLIPLSYVWEIQPSFFVTCGSCCYQRKNSVVIRTVTVTVF